MTEETPPKKPPTRLTVRDLLQFVGQKRISSLWIDDGLGIRAVKHFQIRKDNMGRQIILFSPKEITE